MSPNEVNETMSVISELLTEDDKVPIDRDGMYARNVLRDIAQFAASMNLLLRSPTLARIAIAAEMVNRGASPLLKTCKHATVQDNVFPVLCDSCFTRLSQAFSYPNPYIVEQHTADGAYHYAAGRSGAMVGMTNIHYDNTIHGCNKFIVDFANTEAEFEIYLKHLIHPEDGEEKGN